MAPDGARWQVRLAVLYAFTDLLDVVGLDCDIDGDGEGLAAVVRSLSNDGNWRVRHATVLLLPALAMNMTPAEFAVSFALDGRALDSCALVRLDWVQACASIARCARPESCTPHASPLIPVRAGALAMSSRGAAQMLRIRPDDTRALAGARMKVRRIRLQPARVGSAQPRHCAILIRPLECQPFGVLIVQLLRVWQRVAGRPHFSGVARLPCGGQLPEAGRSARGAREAGTVPGRQCA